MSIKPLQEMTLKDSFMFYAVMNNPETCRELLTRVLEINIQKVTVHGEDSLFYHPQFRGVRLDVIAIENGTQRKFNVEMQVKKSGHLGKRSRYYHSQIDMDMLRSGASYDELPDAYVIFICDFDPFGFGLYRYSFSMQCAERIIGLEDGCKSIFLNSSGSNRTEISAELAEFLDYLSNPELYDKSEDLWINQISNYVEQIKVDREWEGKYMLLYETLKDERQEGREEGREEGRKNLLKEMVSKKMAKNYDVVTIAEQLELPLDLIETLYQEIESEIRNNK